MPLESFPFMIDIVTKKRQKHILSRWHDECRACPNITFILPKSAHYKNERDFPEKIENSKTERGRAVGKRCSSRRVKKFINYNSSQSVDARGKVQIHSNST